MEPDETRSPPPSTKGEPPAAPSDAELSRIAREAVRQPADPRLDKQLARMGLTDDPVTSAPTPRADATASSLKALQGRIRLLETIVWLLVAAVVILTAAVVLLLIR